MRTEKRTKKVRQISGIISCSECENQFQIELLKEKDPKEWNMLTTCPFCGIRLDFCCGFNEIEIMEIPIDDGKRKQFRKYPGSH